jgi:two-component system phosphate regulon response regulator PhoB
MIAVENPAVAGMMGSMLASAGYATLTASTDPEVARLLVDIVPDVLVLDSRLGATVARIGSGTFEADAGPKATVLLLDSGLSWPSEVAAGCFFATLRKPVASETLVEAVARASSGESPVQAPPLAETLGPLLIDHARQMVILQRSGEPARPVALSPSEFRLLGFFANNADRALSRSEILRGVWGATAMLEERTVDVHVVRLRQALEPLGVASMIRTVRGVGYAVAPPVAAGPGAD